MAKSLLTAFGSLFCLLLTPAAGVAAALVQNPSFEDSFAGTFPHYGPVESWAGGSGTNQAAGPFHNGGTPIPDRGQMAFLQGSNRLSQQIVGLTPGQTYWIQYFYDGRACCGGTVDLALEWDGAVLDTVQGVVPSTGGSPYKFKNVSFVPSNAEGNLAFVTSASGDATVLIDAVSIVPGDPARIVVINPSFEASGTPPAPGGPIMIAGWNSSGLGLAGVNDATGPFVDNGTIPDQDRAVVLQGDASISQTLRGLGTGENYTVTYRYNAGTGNAPNLVVSIDGTSIAEQNAIVPVGGVAQWRTATGTFRAAAGTALLTFSQTAGGDQTVLIDDVRVAGTVVEPLPNLKIGPANLEVAPGGSEVVSFTVSGRRLEQGAATVTARIFNPLIARFVGEDLNGEIRLNFPANGGDTTLTAEVEGLARGTTLVQILDNGGHEGVDGSVNIHAVTSFVRNPSFESSPPAAGVGYGPIPAWTTSTTGFGVNNSAMPFFDNGVVPDRNQVAFIQQGPKSLSQSIRGLTSGQRYAVQAFYNARTSAETDSISFTVNFGGQQIHSVSNVTAVGVGNPFHFLNAPFVATGETGLLEFTTSSTGDATLLLDGISIIPQQANEIVVKNPSFEASGLPSGVGYLPAIAGWNFVGGHGINIDAAGPFSDNGISGAQDRVGFLQSPASFSQILEGLTPNATYSLSYSVNARSGDTAGPTPYRVMVDGLELVNVDQEPVGAGMPYDVVVISFVPADSIAELKFEVTAAGGPAADQSLLLDDIRITPAASGVSVPIMIRLIGGNSVSLSWPSSAPGSLVLQSSTSMATNSWRNVDAVPFEEGGNKQVIDVLDGPRKFYRLVQP